MTGAREKDPHCEALLDAFAEVRARTAAICAPLSAEDCILQACEEVSPAKWHLAHTTWFFERFLLRGLGFREEPYHPRFDYIFNSYYEGVGSFHPRPQRGLLARPRLEEVYTYRAFVEAEIPRVIRAAEPALQREALRLLTIGLQHEEQHQELLLTDLKYNMFMQAIDAAPYPALEGSTDEVKALQWIPLVSGLHTIGQSDEEGFAFDNERPAHRTYIAAVAIADRAVSNGAYLDFMQDGGYRRPELWLSEGWQWLSREGIEAPLYWRRAADGHWQQFTLHGWQELHPHETLCHISYYEADAFARWYGARLPREDEWEVFARTQKLPLSALDLEKVQPRVQSAASMASGVWEWTMSSYAPYPAYRSWEGTLGEYNGKFMVNQYVLRGGSCASPKGHLRYSYRNFFPAHARWQFTGLRLAKDLPETWT